MSGLLYPQFGGHLSNHHLSQLMVFREHKHTSNDFQIPQVSSVRSGLYEDRKVFGIQTKNRFNSEHEAWQKETEN